MEHSKRPRKWALILVCLGLATMAFATPAAGQMSVTVLPSDANGDGELASNERLDVQVRLNNPGNWSDLRFTMTPPAGVELIAGSVALGKLTGQVVVGNGPGDTRIDVAFDQQNGATSFISVDFALRAEPCFLMGQDDIALSVRFTASDPTPLDLRSVTRIELVGSGLVGMFATKSDGAATTSPGGSVVYTLGYSSANPSRELLDVRLIETVPAHTVFDRGLSSAGWDCADGAPAGTTCTLTIGDLLCGTAGGNASFGVRVLPSLPAGVDRIVNTVDTYARTFGPFSATDTTPIVGGAPDLAVSKTATPAVATLGEALTYQVTWRNDGSRTATGVQVVERVPAYASFSSAGSSAGWSCANGAGPGTECRRTVGSLDGGGVSGTATFVVVVDNALPAGVSTIENHVEVRDDGAGGPDPTPGNNTATTSTPIASGPGDPGVDLAITKSADRSAVAPADPLLFTLSWVNEGARGASGVTLTETVPERATFDGAASSSGWSCPNGAPAGTSCTLTVGTVQVGATGTARFAVRVVSPLPAGARSIDNTATIVDDGTNGPEEDPADNSASASVPIASGPGDPGVDLAITKSADRSAVAPADPLLFTLSWVNEGARGASGVTLTETVPEHATFDGAASSSGWSCPNGAPAGTSCTLTVGTVQVGATGTARFAVRVVSPLLAGARSIDNTATIVDDGTNGPEEDPADNSASASVPIASGPGDPGVDLIVDKRADRTEVAPGDLLTYSVDWTNDGSRGASGVVVEDSVPEHTRFDAAASDPRWSCVDGAPSGSLCSLSAGTIEVGDSGDATLAVRIVEPLPAGVDVITNMVEIVDDGTNGREENPSDNVAQVTTPIGGGSGPDPGVDLVVEKSARPAQVGPADSLVYDIHWRNDGPRGASGVVVEEQVPSHTTFDAATSDPGWQCDPSGRCLLDAGIVPGGGLAGDSAAFGVLVDSPLAAAVRSIENTALITDDGANGPEENPIDNVVTVTTPIGGTGVGPDIAITKADDRPMGVGPGERITYVLTITNTGNVGSRVLVEETVPAATRFVASASSPGWACDGMVGESRCEATLAELAGGATVELIFAVDVVDPLPADVFQIINEAMVEALDGTDTDPSNDRAVVVTPIRGADDGVGPDLFVDLDDGGVVVEPGDRIEYRILYGNEGNRDASAARLEMAVPSGTRVDDAPGWSCVADPCVLDLGPLFADAPSGETRFSVRVDAATEASQINASIRITGQPDDLDPADNVDTETTPIERRVGRVIATKIDVIADRAAYQDALDAMGLPTAPIVIEYHVDITALAGDVEDAEYRPLAIPDAEYLRYVPGTVASSIGTVELGEPGGFRVVLGDLAEGEAAMISFAMAVDPAIPVDTDSVACQGVVTSTTGLRVVTDDPDTSLLDDPTRTPIDVSGGGSDPVEVPTLGAVGGGLLALLLAMVGARQLGAVGKGG